MVGARMDDAPSTHILTVAYTTPSGEWVTVSWLEGRAPSGSPVGVETVSGRKVLVVHALRGTAAVASIVPAAMREAAAAIESP